MAAFFKYKGIQGNKYIDGRIEAINRDEAAFKLKQQKIIITRLEADSKSVEVKKESRPVLRRKKVPVEEIIVLTKKLETMIRAGLPILQTLEMLEAQTTHPLLRGIVKEVTQDVESGSQLSESFAKHGHVFDNIYINLLKAGESSGKVDLFLNKLVLAMAKSQKIRSDVKGAMIYPTVLLVVAIGVISVMMIFVVPVFQQMFKQMEGGLPAITQSIVSLSEFIRDPMGGGLAAGVVLVLGLAVSAVLKTNYGIRRRCHGFVLKIPLMGDLIQQSALSRISMILGNLIAAGVSVLESLDIASTAVNNLVIREAVVEVQRGVYGGDPLSDLFAKNPDLFPPTFTGMVSVGENTGNLEEMFESISTYYEEEMDSAIQKLTSMLEPVMIVFMGITIGYILIAMYTPMFQMGQALS